MNDFLAAYMLLDHLSSRNRPAHPEFPEPDRERRPPWSRLFVWRRRR